MTNSSIFSNYLEEEKKKVKYSQMILIKILAVSHEINTKTRGKSVLIKSKHIYFVLPKNASFFKRKSLYVYWLVSVI